MSAARKAQFRNEVFIVAALFHFILFCSIVSFIKVAKIGSDLPTLSKSRGYRILKLFASRNVRLP